MSSLLPLALFHLLASVAAAALLATVAKSLRARRPSLPWIWITLCGAVVLPACHLCLAGVLTYRFGPNHFFLLQLLAHGLFAQLPLFLLATAALATRRRSRAIALTATTAAASLLAVAAYAFLVEPFRLEVSRHRVATAKLDAALRVVLVADLQTDRIGDYERRVLATIADLDPDLLLFAGDYIHLNPGPGRVESIDELNRQLRDLDLGGRLGALAVRGNCDGLEWPAVFAGTRIRPVRQDERIDLGPVSVSALSVPTSRSGRSLAPAPGFHIALGHHPDFALGEIEADLLLAGHCHGGQVRLPLVGPPLTLSRIPRRWTSGLHEIAPERYLCVSRGVGMERNGAPQLRFLCRPELVVIDLVPKR